MKENRINKFMIKRVFKKNRDTYDLDNLGIYECPRFISCVDMIKSRNHHLTSDYSLTNSSWEAYLSKIDSNYKNRELWYIREFPLPIISKELYRDLARKFKDSNLLNSIWNNKFFMLDYFFPNLGLAVELDSHWHDGREKEDKIRDLYIESTYGIKVIRAVGYGVRMDPISDNKFNNKFKRTVKDICQQKKRAGYDIDSPFYLNFDDFLNDRYYLIDVGYKTISEISENAYQEFLANECDGKISVSLDWIKDNYPDWIPEEDNLKKLTEFFYEQYSKIMEIENPTNSYK